MNTINCLTRATVNSAVVGAVVASNGRRGLLAATGLLLHGGILVDVHAITARVGLLIVFVVGLDGLLLLHIGLGSLVGHVGVVLGLRGELDDDDVLLLLFFFLLISSRQAVSSKSLRPMSSLTAADWSSTINLPSLFTLLRQKILTGPCFLR